jgi:hypothetical protein
MKEATLSQYRQLSHSLSAREKLQVEIHLKNDRVLAALYDPFFNTVTIGGITIPAAELSFWTKLCWGSKPKKITKKL